MDYLLLNQSELPAVNGVRASEGRLCDEASVSLLFVEIPPGDGPACIGTPIKRSSSYMTGKPASPLEQYRWK
jgi:hypothetical protein